MAASPRVLEIDQDAASRWDAFVQSIPGASAYHGYVWREIVEAEFGCETFYLAALDAGDEVQGVLPLARLKSMLFGDFLVSLPYFTYGGCLAASPSADSLLMDHAVRLAEHLGVSHVEFRETRERGPEWPVRTDKVAMVLPLADNPAAQWGALSSKLRSQIRRPEREGAVTRFGGPELVGDFYSVFARNMRDLGTPVYARAFFQRMVRKLGPAVEIGVTYIGKEPVASGFLLHHRTGTEIPWASSLREWNRAGVNMQLYWEVIQRAIGRGSRQFDFGRSTVDAGTYRFKAQWGATPRPLFWNYWLRPGRELPRLNPSNPKFDLAIRAWQKLPLPLANLLGPRIVRRLP